MKTWTRTHGKIKHEQGHTAKHTYIYIFNKWQNAYKFLLFFDNLLWRIKILSLNSLVQRKSLIRKGKTADLMTFLRIAQPWRSRIYARIWEHNFYAERLEEWEASKKKHIAIPFLVILELDENHSIWITFLKTSFKARPTVQIWHMPFVPCSLWKLTNKTNG